MNDTDESNKQTLDKPTTGPKRRAFVKTAAGAALLSTVVSRPVWASHCSISGNLSGNLSGQHDEEPCTLVSYSPGGWLNGSANHNGLWEHTGLNPQTPVARLLGPINTSDGPSTREDKKKPGLGAESTIADALGGGNHGWERQCASAALNALLWENLLLACEGDPGGCSILDKVDPEFYFPYTLGDIQAVYQGGPNGTYLSLWEQSQTID
ncbi:hypothetical protein [Kineobactrum salinum]|uniref:Uncharacterized protein n=1 Tax=Kineobactrum salinum TaxID=2708301 RepID=A0A6C0TY22_9GAMM|nr:hypothetical protein [Kineobactrum salinum]QIB64732.1 hypothetical protein G3T16_04335 [Kineobactrum salinum]